MNDPAATRFHGLDALRGSMMLLGVVIHAAVSYTVTPLGRAWIYKDPSTSWACDLGVFFLHAFRMPAFFVMAGFFAGLLIERRGPRAFLRHRGARIGLPFLIFWPLLMPAIGASFVLALVGRDQGLAKGLVSGLGFLFRPDLWYSDSTAHLWFLYDLLLLCLLTVGLGALLGRLPVGLRRGAGRAFESAFRSPGRLVLLTILTAPTLMLMPTGTPATSTSFVPDPRTLIFYGLFWCIGLALWRRRALLETTTRRVWPKLALAVLVAPFQAAAVGALGAALAEGEPPSSGLLLLSSFLGAALCWCAILGLLGLFQRRFSRPSPLARWVSDSSYWVYLIHLPVVVFATGLMARLPWPALLKAGVAVAATSAFCFGTYWLFVRSTALGALLNGRRFPRGLAAAESGTVAVPSR